MSLWGRCAPLDTLLARSQCFVKERGECGCVSGVWWRVGRCRLCAALNALLALPWQLLVELQRLRGICQ